MVQVDQILVAFCSLHISYRTLQLGNFSTLCIYSLPGTDADIECSKSFAFCLQTLKLSFAFSILAIYWLTKKYIDSRSLKKNT
jgi:hypothetical protein